MKKWIAAIIIFILAILALVYLLFPSGHHVVASATLAANREGLQRQLSSEKSWPDWWPGEQTHNGSHSYRLGDRSYSITDQKIASLQVEIMDMGKRYPSLLNLISVHLDSTDLVWELAIPRTNNPVRRIETYFRARRLRKDMNTVLQAIARHYSRHENIYGLAIREEKVVDSTLVSTFGETREYPGIDFIYSLVDELKNYIRSQNASERGYPMLNIHTSDSLHYLTRVAIPVDKRLPTSGNISYKWMLPGGNILVAEVKGGPAEIAKAFRQMERYLADHKRTDPAIPFLSLVTDRRLEKDTARWITRIYYPVI